MIFKLFTRKRLALMSLCFVSSASLASIGITAEVYQDIDRHRVINTKIFYPTTKTKSEELYADNPAFYGFNAVKNAPPTGSELPVYILVHGTSGNWKNLSWLGSRLAEEGALVISANHPDYTTGQATPDSVMRMWEQPRDVSFLIDKLLASTYVQYIDKKNITVVGYSLGGYTALSLAGAKFDISGYQNYCLQNKDDSCDYYKGVFKNLTQEDRVMISGDYRDKRVSKSIAISPGYVPAILSDSLDDLSANTIVVGAEFDEVIPPEKQLNPYLAEKHKNLFYVEISGASHFSFMQKCKPQATAILAEEGAEFVCQEASNINRKSIHNELISTSLYFQ
ncbi:alpha/beta hydrolase family protein [Moritella dasanensis]|uniref:alpha/beta hydrolase family protein n=1 Tax=Moritella dasanensis TaxID=428031 RepID=UPI0002F32CFF|nr:alpha/beta fold hydrolase [Moritella dasanensis]